MTELARLHAGQERRRIAPFDVAELLRRLCDDLRAVADGKGLFLKMSGAATLAVEGDAVKVRRIAQNLLLNSLKYTQRGGVTISWGDTPEHDDARWWLGIEDSGPGFDAGSVATPGEQPAAEDASPAHPSRGEGLGLAIVKRLCELLGASLELDTSPGRGTTIRVLVPRRYAAAPA